MNADDRIAKLRSDKDEAENLLAILTELHEMDARELFEYHRVRAEAERVLRGIPVVDR